jgi:hypothetical protein
MGQVRTALLILVLLPPLTFAKDRVRDTTICAINSHEREYGGEMVRIRGRVVQGFEWFFVESKEGCSLSLAYPDGPAELGAEAMFQPSPEPKIPVDFKLLRDENYKKFVAYANEVVPQKRGCICLGCYRYEVTVTMTGMIQMAKAGGPGFAHMNAARSRLVIRSVSEVEAVDVSKKYKDPVCGMPKLTLPANPYPGWNQPMSVPPFTHAELNPK